MIMPLIIIVIVMIMKIIRALSMTHKKLNWPQCLANLIWYSLSSINWERWSNVHFERITRDPIGFFLSHWAYDCVKSIWVKKEEKPWNHKPRVSDAYLIFSKRSTKSRRICAVITWRQWLRGDTWTNTQGTKRRAKVRTKRKKSWEIEGKSLKAKMQRKKKQKPIEWRRIKIWLNR